MPGAKNGIQNVNNCSRKKSQIVELLSSWREIVWRRCHYHQYVLHKMKQKFYDIWIFHCSCRAQYNTHRGIKSWNWKHVHVASCEEVDLSADQALWPADKIIIMILMDWVKQKIPNDSFSESKGSTYSKDVQRCCSLWNQKYSEANNTGWLLLHLHLFLILVWIFCKRISS
jgi:hypothetical protein